MGSAYMADGRRRSSMTHARRGHVCTFCGATSLGNGGAVSHARSHVRTGEAVEIVKWYPGVAAPSRLFLPADDPRIPNMIAEGFERATP